jgi:hypothetical protein
MGNLAGMVQNQVKRVRLCVDRTQHRKMTCHEKTRLRRSYGPYDDGGLGEQLCQADGDGRVGPCDSTAPHLG